MTRSSVDVMRLVDHTSSIIDSVSTNLQSTQIIHEPQTLHDMMNRTVSMIENLNDQDNVKVERNASEEIDDAEGQKENNPPAEPGITEKFKFFHFFKTKTFLKHPLANKKKGKSMLARLQEESEKIVGSNFTSDRSKRQKKAKK